VLDRSCRIFALLDEAQGSFRAGANAAACGYRLVGCHRFFIEIDIPVIVKREDFGCNCRATRVSAAQTAVGLDLHARAIPVKPNASPVMSNKFIMPLPPCQLTRRPKRSYWLAAISERVKPIRSARPTTFFLV
jgi:hypothetical protein